MDIEAKRQALLNGTAVPLFVTTRQLAELLEVDESSLRQARVRGDGIPYVVLNRRSVRYDLRDVQAWLDARKVRSTADHARRRMTVEARQ